MTNLRYSDTVGSQTQPNIWAASGQAALFLYESYSASVIEQTKLQLLLKVIGLSLLTQSVHHHKKLVQVFNNSGSSL